MNEYLPESEQWLSLGAAAELLNVHPTTLRRWANNAEIPFMLTPGGHRRFAPGELARFARARQRIGNKGHIEELWAREALMQTRQEIVAHPDQRWLVHLDEETRNQQRALGQQLMGLTLQYLSDSNEAEHLLTEAHKIGMQYAFSALRVDMPLAEALQAAMFFRDALVETALHLPEETRIRPEANIRLLRRINTLLNTVNLAIAEIYDASRADR